MIVFVCFVVSLLWVWWRLRRRRAAMLAGRDSGRPVYTIEPPSRRQERSSRGVL